jgi:hypothetical protein
MPYHVALMFGVAFNLGAAWSLPSPVVAPPIPHADSATSTRVSSPDGLMALITFSPRLSPFAVEPPGRDYVRRDGAVLAARRQFLAERLAEFHTMVARYGMDPNDLATARAFAIVAGYRAYNGAHLSDPTSGEILFGLLAVQTAEQQLDHPWSDAQKQAMYEKIGTEATALNWSLERALHSRDLRALGAVRSRARELLRHELGRDPNGITPDTYACVTYRAAPCREVIRELRGTVETAITER